MAIDDSGNGMITEQRLREILSRPEARVCDGPEPAFYLFMVFVLASCGHVIFLPGSCAPKRASFEKSGKTQLVSIFRRVIKGPVRVNVSIVPDLFHNQKPTMPIRNIDCRVAHVQTALCALREPKPTPCFLG